VGESTSTFASKKGSPLADVERLKGNRRRELRNEKYPFNYTDFASLNLRIYSYHLVAHRVGLWEAWFLLFNCQLVDELLPLVYVKPSSPGGKCCLSNKAGLAQIWCFDYCRAMKRFQGIAFQAEEDFRCNLQMSSKHQICARPSLRVIYYLEKSKCFQTHITNCCTAHFR